MGWNAGRARAAERGAVRSRSRSGDYESASTDEISTLCRPIRRCALEIDDATVREHLDKVSDLLPNADAASAFGAAHPASLAWAVQQTSESLISAYLRDVPLPHPLPEDPAHQFIVFNDAYSAMLDMWAAYEDE